MTDPGVMNWNHQLNTARSCRSVWYLLGAVFLLITFGMLPKSVRAQGATSLRRTFESELQVWNRSVAFGWADDPIEESFAYRVEVVGSATWHPLGWLTLVGGAELRARTYDVPTDDPYSVDVFLDPTYLQATRAQYRLRIGHQIVKWGRTDEISPLDNVNPVDLRDGPLRAIQERKRPLPMVNLEYVRGLTSIEMLWIPYFRSHGIDYFGGNWGLFGLGNCRMSCPEVNAEDVPLRLSNSEIGARLAFAAFVGPCSERILDARRCADGSTPYDSARNWSRTWENAVRLRPAGAVHQSVYQSDI